jgi:dTDP-4-amino-4,6-dideoxygalactose transaminase
MSTFTVPYVDYSNKNASIREQLVSVFGEVLDSGRYIQGPRVNTFENEFAAYCGTEHAAGVANGTCSLEFVLRAWELPENSEVITTPNSFVASAASIVSAGLKIRFVDVLPDLNMDPEQLEAAITPQTRVIMPVHLTGRPANMVEITRIARKYHLLVLEDAAQAVGATLHGEKVGSFGDAASFSLHPLKNLHAFGDAGIVTSNDQELIRKLNLLKNHGLSDRSTCEVFSRNCRLDEVQAALLSVQIKYLDGWTIERRNLAQRYNDELRDFVQVPEEVIGEYHVYQTYVVKAKQRNKLQDFLRTSGIEALVHYPTPIHLQPAFTSHITGNNSFPIAEKLSSEILSLPLFIGMNEGQQTLVINKIKEFYA